MLAIDVKDSNPLLETPQRPSCCSMIYQKRLMETRIRKTANEGKKAMDMGIK
jgi:hypothetical protein